jgi:hypothetical protein
MNQTRDENATMARDHSPHHETPPMLTILIIYCAIIAAVSVLGGLVPILMKLSHRGMQMALSMVSGVLIGVAILHMLPHALHEGGTNDGIFMAMLAGFLTLFLSTTMNPIPPPGMDVLIPTTASVGPAHSSV